MVWEGRTNPGDSFVRSENLFLCVIVEGMDKQTITVRYSLSCVFLCEWIEQKKGEKGKVQMS